MSTKKGSVERKNRPQKHQNKFAFKNDLHDKTPQIKVINSINVCEVCEHCKSVIEWKIKYRKYKPLKQPKSCTKCGDKTVKRAYHVICRDCAIKHKVCAKCLKSGDEVTVIPPEPTEEEKLKLKIEMDQLLKTLPERKRRTFLRYMNQKNKKKAKENEDEDSDSEEQEAPTRAQLLEKFEQLKLAAKNGKEEDDDDFFGDGEDDDFDDLLSDEDFSD